MMQEMLEAEMDVSIGCPKNEKGALAGFCLFSTVTATRNLASVVPALLLERP
jgi:hypothetical protein